MNYFLTILFTCFVSSLFAQEFEAQVSVNYNQMQVTAPEVFKSLEEKIRSFYNNRRFTKIDIKENERIKLNIQINISSEAGSSFGGEFTVQASRPVYGTTYETVILSHKDKDFTFVFDQFLPLEFSDNAYLNNLSHFLTYYAYLTLGFNAESFAPYGGQKYFEKCRELILLVPASGGGGGWNTTDKTGRNRYWIIENLLNPKTKPFREGWYDYHRLGLDQMSEKPLVGRAIIQEALAKFDKTRTDYQTAFVLIMFSNAKMDEMAEIFKVADKNSRDYLIQVMNKIDPANLALFRKDLN